MKLLRLSALLGIFFTLVPGVLLAQAALKESVPVNGSIIRAAPAQLELTFTEEVQLLKLAISGINSKMIPTKFKPTADAHTSFAIPLPGMYEDAYVVAWTILGKDGREVENKLTFIVDADAGESAADSQ
jgi:methionine-rich copper-binding protein CopC